MPHKIVPDSKYPNMYRIVRGGGKVHRDEFNTYLGDRLLCSSSRTPFVDAARSLITAGHDPEATLVTRHRASKHDALWAKLGYAATLTVSGTQFALFKGELPTAS